MMSNIKKLLNLTNKDNDEDLILTSPSATLFQLIHEQWLFESNFTLRILFHIYKKHITTKKGLAFISFGYNNYN
jgi:hypothetical protein